MNIYLKKLENNLQETEAGCRGSGWCRPWSPPPPPSGCRPRSPT